MNPTPDPEQWFSENVLPHEPALRGWLRHQFPDLRDIDEIVQESFIRVLRAHALGDVASPKAFLFTTARHVAIDAFRRERAIGDHGPEFDAEHVAADGPGVAEIIGHRQELALLTQAMQSLPQRCRQVLTLRKIYGLSQKQIAATLDLSEHTVEAQVGIALRRCAEFLARHSWP